MEITAAAVLALLAYAVYALPRRQRRDGTSSGTKGLSDKEIAATRRLWMDKLRRVHAGGRLFVIPDTQNAPRSVRRYEKRAPLDVKVHRFRLEATASQPALEVNAIEFTTNQSLQQYEQRIAAKGLEPNAANTLLAS